MAARGCKTPVRRWTETQRLPSREQPPRKGVLTSPHNRNPHEPL